MPKSGNKPAHVSRGNVFEDLGFSPEEAAILRMKTQLHIEIMRAIEKQGLTPRQLEKVLDVPQPRVSELRERQDFADDGGLAGEVSLPPGAGSRR